MILLFDQNISPRMVHLVSNLFPQSSHVRNHGLQRADDETIWKFAREKGFVIVSKDADFHERSFLYGFPPKVVWLRTGNCTTNDLEKIIRTQHNKIVSFCSDDKAAFLIIP